MAEQKEKKDTVSRIELITYPSSNQVWQGFISEKNINENNLESSYTIPGQLATTLANLCARDGTIELTAEKIMFYSELTNYLILLKKNGDTIGFLLLELFAGSSQPKIWLLCISSSEKGNNYSKILIDKAKRLSKEKGKTTIHLEALTRKIGTKIYKPQGFTFNKSRGEDMTATLSSKKTRKNRRTTYS